MRSPVLVKVAPAFELLPKLTATPEVAVGAKVILPLLVNVLRRAGCGQRIGARIGKADIADVASHRLREDPRFPNWRADKLPVFIDRGSLWPLKETLPALARLILPTLLPIEPPMVMAPVPVLVLEIVPELLIDALIVMPPAAVGLSTRFIPVPLLVMAPVIWNVPVVAALEIVNPFASAI